MPVGPKSVIKQMLDPVERNRRKGNKIDQCDNGPNKGLNAARFKVLCVKWKYDPCPSRKYLYWGAA